MEIDKRNVKVDWFLNWSFSNLNTHLLDWRIWKIDDICIEDDWIFSTYHHSLCHYVYGLKGVIFYGDRRN